MEGDPPAAQPAKPNPPASKPAVILTRGQGIAAYVPYSKKKREWIIASVETFFPETNEYLVKDQFPDGRKKMDSWMVRANEVIKFPADATDVYTPGERVLALWRMENGDWSSMFYEAVVTGGCTKENDVDVRFDGDDQVHVCSRSRVVKLPPGVTDPVLPDQPRKNPVGRPPKDPEKRRLQQMLDDGAGDDAWNAKRMKSSDPASARSLNPNGSASRLHDSPSSSSSQSSSSADQPSDSSSSEERPVVVVHSTGKRRGRPPNSVKLQQLQQLQQQQHQQQPSSLHQHHHQLHLQLDYKDYNGMGIGMGIGGSSSSSSSMHNAGNQHSSSSSQFPYPCGVIEKKKLKYQQLQAARMKQHQQQTT